MNVISNIAKRITDTSLVATVIVYDYDPEQGQTKHRDTKQFADECELAVHLSAVAAEATSNASIIVQYPNGDRLKSKFLREYIASLL